MRKISIEKEMFDGDVYFGEVMGDGTSQFNEAYVEVEINEKTKEVESCTLYVKIDNYLFVDSSFTHHFGIKKQEELEYQDTETFVFKQDDIEIESDITNDKIPVAGVIFKPHPEKHLVTLYSE